MNQPDDELSASAVLLLAEIDEVLDELGAQHQIVNGDGLTLSRVGRIRALTRSATRETAYERARRTRLTEDPCKCGQHKVPVGIDGVNWYWSRHSREECTLELPNATCWCGLLRSEHATGHKEGVEPPINRADGGAHD